MFLVVTFVATNILYAYINMLYINVNKYFINKFLCNQYKIKYAHKTTLKNTKLYLYYVLYQYIHVDIYSKSDNLAAYEQKDNGFYKTGKNRQRVEPI